MPRGKNRRLWKNTCYGGELYNVDSLATVWGNKQLIALRDPVKPEIAYLVDKGEYASAITYNRVSEAKSYLSRN